MADREDELLHREHMTSGVVDDGDKDVQHEHEWKDLTDDAGVKKRTIRSGTGEAPELHSVCLVHYQARHQADGSLIADTRAEKDGGPVTVIAGRECVQRDKGLNVAVLSMSVGELCQVTVTPEYGYGDKGNFSFPSVQPNAHVEYEVELLGVTPPQEKERKNMFFEERLEAATRMRARGKRLFSEGDINGALAQNSVAIEYVDDELLFQLQGFHLEQAQAVRAPLHLNVAACHLLLDKWQAAVDAATAALAVTAPDNKELFAKALFRRAKARKELRQTDQAINDLEQALKRCPDDVLVSQELTKLRKQQKAEQKAVDDLFRNKMPAPKATPGIGDSTNENHHSNAAQRSAINDAQRYTAGETWFYAMAKVVIEFLSSVLRALGLATKVTASANS